MTRPFFPAALAVLTTCVSILPANAQTSSEFGYRDGIFKLKYLAPETFAERQSNKLQMNVLLANLLNPNSDAAEKDPRAKQILQGTCAEIYLRPYRAITNWSPEQKYILSLPNKSRDTPLREKIGCTDQLSLFSLAFIDPLSTPTQLQWLANSMRQRFADEWISDGEAQTAEFQRGAKNLGSLLVRTGQFEFVGLTVPPDLKQPLVTGTLKARIISLADPVRFAALNAQMSALEKQAPELWRRLQEEEKDAAKKAEVARLTEEADAAVARAQIALKEMRDLYEDALMRARFDPDPNSSAARSAEYYRALLQDREQGLRSALVRREQLQAHLAKVAMGQPATGVQEAPLSNVPPPLVSEAGECRPGARCSTTEKVVFCSGLEALQAVLARPAGTERRTLLRALMGRGECAILDVGTEIATRGPVRHVTPIGEAPVEAVAATMETGRKGFVLLSGLSAAQTASR